MAVALRKCGDERLHDGSKELPLRLLDFWRWMGSDLLSNATRGRLAEYLVACDLGVAEGVRREWVAYDVTAKDGTKVEVKSAAYIQGWAQRRPSIISFGIQPTLGWDPDTAKFGDARRRQADVYVFCLLHEKEEAKIDPLNVTHWRFYALPTSALNTSCPVQKTITLQKLLALQPEQAAFGGVAAAVRRAATR